MKKRTCVIGYTKACRRLEQLHAEAVRRGQSDQATEIQTVLSGILGSARERHRCAAMWWVDWAAVDAFAKDMRTRATENTEV